jgi:signal transduction histidine kinase
VIIVLSSALIYIFSAEYRQNDFYERLANKANNTAKLLIEVDEVDVILLRRIEQDNPVSLPNEKIVIYNYRDTVLFTTDESNSIRIDEKRLDQIRLEDEVRWIQGEYEVLGFLYKGKYDRFVVVAAATDIFGYKRLTGLMYILLVVFAISVVIISASAWIYAGKALQPIAKVVKRVDEITISSLNLRVDEGNGEDEIAKLAHTFNNMLARLETSFLAQKNFISNASHELRTPLTAITGQLEVTLLNSRSPDEYKAVINSVLEDIKSLNNLSNKLLMLAQASSEERKNRMALIRIDELVWQAKEELSRLHNNFTILIDLDENLDDEHKLTIKGDEQLMKTAFSNIIENGCKYSANATVNVFISGSINGITLTFRDKGIGISKDEIPNIFEPFYRGGNTKNISGHGIGLSMAKGIIKLHDGTLDLLSIEGKGTVVTINLPLAFRAPK